ncbi:pentatricopeptide repeat-containing protein [Quercus suber]|uniref:Pentatricopeptide repeat-containing protein n=1 Tax=Quercus suber TaxID=58331 RepID=A0AAW0LL89_QUESU
MLFQSTKLKLTQLFLLLYKTNTPKTKTHTLPLILSFSRALTTATNESPNKNNAVSNNDQYFAAIHHVSNIVRRDFYLERTLNKLSLRVTSELVFRVLRACSSAATESHRFFNWALTQPNYHPTSLEFEELIKSLARARKFQTMWDLVHRFNKSQSHSFSLSPETVSFLIEQYGKHGLIDQAVEIFNKTHKTLNCPQTIEIHNSLLFSLCEAKLFHGAYALIRRMVRKNLAPNKRTYAVLVNAWCSAGKLREAQDFLEEMSRKGLNPPVRGRDLLMEGLHKTLNCPQTIEIHNSLLFSLCEAKLFHGAYALIRRMVRKNLAPNKRTYAVLVNAWCSSGKLREAQDFLEEMSRKGLNPPVRGRDLLMEGLLNAGHLEAAKDMARKMAKQGFVPDLETFNSLIESISKSNDEEVEFCVSLFNSVCKLGLSPDINTYKILIPTVSKAGMVDEAFRLLNDSIEKGHKPFPSLYAPLIKAMCRRGQFDDAFCFFSEMKVKGHAPNRPVYTMLITMCGRGGKFVEASNYLVEMTEFGLTPISRCFDMVTDGLKNCGKHDLARRIEQLEVNIRGTRILRSMTLDVLMSARVVRVARRQYLGNADNTKKAELQGMKRFQPNT